MFNARSAADVISGQNNQEIVEIVLNDVESEALYVFGLGSGSNDTIRVTAAWTDPAGPFIPTSLDSPTLTLVNDIDIRLRHTSGTTALPYVLDPANPSAAAAKGDNFRDVIEQIDMDIDPATRPVYKLTVSHKDALTNGNQAVSLILSGGYFYQSADLSAGPVTWALPFVQANQTFTAETIISNTGPGSVADAVAQFYLSADNVIDSEDMWIGSQHLGPLEANGASSLATISATAPEMAGDYFIGACAQVEVDEFYTDNQCSTGVPLTILPRGGGNLVLLDEAGLAKSSGTIKRSVVVPVGATALRVETLGGTGGLKLLVRENKVPTNSVFDCRSAAPGTEQSCVINNPAPGLWQIKLLRDGSFADVRLLVTSTVGGSANMDPVAAFAATPAAAALAINFDGSASTDDSGIVDWNWQFGDGNTASGESVSHTYATPGDYDVTLTVTDDQGATGSTTKSVMVAGLGGTVILLEESGLTRTAGADKRQVEVPTGTARLIVETIGGSGNLTLLVREGRNPTTTNFDCRSAGPDTNEFCVLDNPQPGDWRIKLQRKGSYADVTLVVRAEGDAR